MPKTKKRYLILFNVMNKTERVYKPESFGVLRDSYFVKPTVSEGLEIGLHDVCAICKVGIDGIGLYAYDFKFFRNGLTPNNELTKNAKELISVIKNGPAKTLVTASRASVDPDGTVGDCVLLYLFFTDEPSFDLNQ